MRYTRILLMKKIISFTFLSLCISTQSITMDRDRTDSNQKQRNEKISRATESPTNLRVNIQKKKEKQISLKPSQDRSLKYSSGDSYNQ